MFLIVDSVVDFRAKFSKQTNTRHLSAVWSPHARCCLGGWPLHTKEEDREDREDREDGEDREAYYHHHYCWDSVFYLMYFRRWPFRRGWNSNEVKLEPSRCQPKIIMGFNHVHLSRYVTDAGMTAADWSEVGGGTVVVKRFIAPATVEAARRYVVH